MQISRRERAEAVFGFTAEGTVRGEVIIKNFVSVVFACPVVLKRCIRLYCRYKENSICAGLWLICDVAVISVVVCVLCFHVLFWLLHTNMPCVCSHEELVRGLNTAIKFSLGHREAVTLNNEGLINCFPLSISATIDSSISYHITKWEKMAYSVTTQGSNQYQGFVSKQTYRF